MEVDILMADFISPVLWGRFQTRNRQAMVGRPIRVTRRYILQSLSRILWEIKITQLLEDFGHYSVVKKKYNAWEGNSKILWLSITKCPCLLSDLKSSPKVFWYVLIACTMKPHTDLLVVKQQYYVKIWHLSSILKSLKNHTIF